PIPPRSEGQVGRFSRNGTGVTVARITYPDPMFAEPHVNWIEERIALLPQSYEQYLVAGPTVIHINGESVGVAAAAHDAFEQLIAGEGHDQP
ncbi:MAG: hypothetical protein KC561_16370, partial [Myxococcales bacterium]|nr:hypothetical protein [Myxococcales bacterium]